MDLLRKARLDGKEVSPGHPLRAELTWLGCSLELWCPGEKSSEPGRTGGRLGGRGKSLPRPPSDLLSEAGILLLPTADSGSAQKWVAQARGTQEHTTAVRTTLGPKG